MIFIAGALKRRARVLGMLVLVSAALVFAHSFVQIRAAGLVVALVLGSLVLIAISLDNRILMAVAGIGFLLAAGVQLLLGAGDNSGFSAVTGRRSRCGWRWVLG